MEKNTMNKKTKTLYSAESLFDLIMQELKDEGKIPDILDYRRTRIP